ncbi:MAG TPA: sigma-54-dependent Fis family transcriptional regulator, partial [Gammaproteobacteria bacterium]|nr:sigma-54-dependent Fis family transcriptional regulator [Gammaproteobacteria bacterium]
PPLRERAGDAELLAKSFLQQFAQESKKSVKGFTPEAIQLINSYSWPGNVRELKSSVKRGVIMADGALVNDQDLGLRQA